MARTLSCALLGLLAFAVFCELLMRALPVSSSTESGYYVDDMILTYPAHHRWQAATGWDLRNAQSMRSNNFGFAAERDFKHNSKAVALVGDSFVEASMLRSIDRPGPQLERALDHQRPVYAMGGPGSSLLDYAERIRFARERFGVQDFVVLLERGDVRQSLCGSANIHAACLEPNTFAAKVEKQPAPSLAKRILRRSALAQYLFSQLKLSPARLWKQTFTHATPAHPSLAPAVEAKVDNAGRAGRPSPAVDAVVAAFFERIRPHVGGRLVLVIDSDRASSNAARTTVDPDRRRLMELARNRGAVVVDTEDIFRRHAATSTLSLNVGPYDGHFNALAVELITRAAAEALRAPVKPDALPKDSLRAVRRSAGA